MKKTLLAGLALAMTASISSAGGEGWMTDFEAAKAKAAKENKDLLVDFTGSDWCGWCIKLVDEVFKHDSFKKGVADKFVLVELDYPRDKSKVDEATTKQNAELQKKYSVRGFPTILLLDPEGRPYAKTGYKAGGPEKYLEHLAELQAKRVERDKALESAAKLQGAAKAEALVKALEALPENQLKHYQSLIDKVKTLDPEDKTGFVKKQEYKMAHTTLMSEIRKGSQDEVLGKIDSFIKEHNPQDKELSDLQGMKLQIKVGGMLREKKITEALALVDKHIADHKLEGEALQSALGIKMGPLINSGKFDEAEQVVENIVAAGANTRAGKFAEKFKTRLAKMKADAAAKKETEKEPAAAE
ncbi:MAG: thioredoxin family protein [Akkermansiaceae bacterium]